MAKISPLKKLIDLGRFIIAAKLSTFFAEQIKKKVMGVQIIFSRILDDLKNCWPVLGPNNLLH